MIIKFLICHIFLLYFGHAYFVNGIITSIECTWLNLYKFTGYEVLNSKLFLQLEDNDLRDISLFCLITFQHLAVCVSATMCHLAKNNESSEYMAFLGILICVVAGILVSIVIELCIIKVLIRKAYGAGIDQIRRNQVINSHPDNVDFIKCILYKHYRFEEKSEISEMRTIVQLFMNI